MGEAEEALGGGNNMPIRVFDLIFLVLLAFLFHEINNLKEKVSDLKDRLGGIDAKG